MVECLLRVSGIKFNMIKVDRGCADEYFALKFFCPEKMLPIVYVLNVFVFKR